MGAKASTGTRVGRPEPALEGVTLEDVLAWLEDAGCKPKRDRHGWLSLCPAHDDRQGSLRITRGDRRPFLLACLSKGCSYTSILTALRHPRPRPATSERADAGPGESIRPLLSAERVAEILDITVSGLMFHCRAGHLPMVKVGRLNRFQPADVEAYIASRVKRG